MAKKKKKRGRQGFASKLLNVFGIAIAFARPIQIVVNNIDNLGNIIPKMLSGLTFGLTEGPFDLSEGVKMYAPIGASAAFGFIKSYAMRKFPIR